MKEEKMKKIWFIMFGWWRICN